MGLDWGLRVGSELLKGFVEVAVGLLGGGEWAGGQEVGRGGARPAQTLSTSRRRWRRRLIGRSSTRRHCMHCTCGGGRGGGFNQGELSLGVELEKELRGGGVS